MLKQAALCAIIESHIESITITPLDYLCIILFVIASMGVVSSIAFMAGRMYERRG